MSDATSLTIIQLNDSHTYFDSHQELFWQENRAVYRPAGGYARIAALVRQMRENSGERLLFCDCGDTLNGTYHAVETQGPAMVHVLNALGLDAMTVHWEYAFGPSALKKLAAEFNFPVLAINVFDKTTNEPIFPPFNVKEIDGLRVGLIGIASNIVSKTMPASYSEGVRFTLGREELPAVIDRLRAQEHVDLIILISHLGFPQDMKLLSEVEGVDLCLSGHTHNRITQPVHQGNTLVIQSGCNGSFLGRIDLELNSGKITGYEHHLIEVESGAIPDPAVSDIIQHVLSPFNAELATLVGETATALNRTTVPETKTDDCLLESLLEATWGRTRFFKWLAIQRPSYSQPAHAE
jgi:sulfur-oxidizing protein SoxB